MMVQSKFRSIAGVFMMVALFALVIGCEGLMGSSSASDDDSPTGPVTVVYVSLAGSSAGSGESPDSPLDTISEGIARAAVLGISRVNVAEGTYDISDSVEMQEGISLYGGYSADFTSRDPKAFETVINDTRTDAPQWARAVFLGPEITNATVLDGFTVNAPSGSTHQGALRITGAPVVRNNILKGSISGSDNRVVSIGTTDGAVIMNNEIVARSSAHADTGIYVGKHAVIVNNIARSTGASSSRLISLRGGGGMVVVNNLIICGSSGTNYALHIEITGAPVIDIRNNIIYGTDSSGTTYGVYEHTNNTGPAILQQNNIFSVDYLARTRRGGSTATINNMTELNDPATLSPTETGGNIGVDMVTGGHFVDPGNGNWQLSDTCTQAVGGGGQDLSGVFSVYGLPSVDKQGTSRGTGSWSMGPYVPAFPLQPDSYTVSYDGNGETVGDVPAESSHYHNDTVTVSNPGDLRGPSIVSGITQRFVAWNTQKNGDGTSYQPSETFHMPHHDVTLYAMWTTGSDTVGKVGPAGGLVFYDNEEQHIDGWRFLEAAPSSTEWERKPWGGRGTLVGHEGRLIGTGAAMTEAIVDKYGAEEPYADRHDYAAKLCADLDYGDKTDWFLPAREELIEMYENLFLHGIGDFAADTYWSAQENTKDYAIFYRFHLGHASGNPKNALVRVRAARAF